MTDIMNDNMTSFDTGLHDKAGDAAWNWCSWRLLWHYSTDS